MTEPRIAFFHVHVDECDPVCVLRSFGADWNIEYATERAIGAAEAYTAGFLAGLAFDTAPSDEAIEGYAAEYASLASETPRPEERTDG